MKVIKLYVPCMSSTSIYLSTPVYIYIYTVSKHSCSNIKYNCMIGSMILLYYNSPITKKLISSDILDTGWPNVLFIFVIIFATLVEIDPKPHSFYSTSAS